MGLCIQNCWKAVCKRHLIKQLKHFKIYRLDTKPSRETKFIKISIVHDKYKINPNFMNDIDSGSIVEYQDNVIQLLGDENGIVTYKDKIENIIQQIVIDCDKKKYKNLCFQALKLNYDNQRDLYGKIVIIIMNSDQRYQFTHLRNIYLSWKDLQGEQEKIIEQKIRSISILADQF